MECVYCGHPQPGLIRDPESASAQPRGHHNKHSVHKASTVLLEYYFAGEKPT